MHKPAILLFALLAFPDFLIADERVIFEKAVKQACTKVVNSLEQYKGIERIAVINIKNDKENMVTDLLISAIVQSKKYQVIEREMLSEILREQKLELSEIMNNQTAARAGQILGVHAVMFGKVARQQVKDGVAEVTFYLRLVDKETAEILWANTIEGRATARFTFFNKLRGLHGTVRFTLCILAIIICFAILRVIGDRIYLLEKGTIRATLCITLAVVGMFLFFILPQVFFTNIDWLYYKHSFPKSIMSVSWFALAIAPILWFVICGILSTMATGLIRKDPLGYHFDI